MYGDGANMNALAGIARPACAPPASAHAPRGTWDLPWLPATTLETGGTVTFELSGTPDPTWAADPAASPPSFGGGPSPGHC